MTPAPFRHPAVPPLPVASSGDAWPLRTQQPGLRTPGRAALSLPRLPGWLALLLLLCGTGLPAPVVAQTPELDRRFDPLEDSIRGVLFSDPGAALGYAGRYLTRAGESGEPLYLGKGENFTGLAYYVLGDVSLAIDAYLRALQHFEAVGAAWHVAVVHNNIGAAHQLRRKPDETLVHYERALDGFRALNDTVWTANLLNNMAIQYLIAGDVSRAYETQSEALAIHTTRGDSASMHLMQGNLASTLFSMGEVERALEYAGAFLASPRADDDLPHKANVLITLSRAQAAEGRNSEALGTINQALELSRSRGFREQAANATQQLSAIQEAMGDHRTALATFRTFHSLYDTLYSREKDERITELLTEYEVARKDAAIDLLQAENELARRNQWLLGLGVLLLLVASGAILGRVRSRQRHIRVLEEKNRTISGMLDEKEYLIREIHHRVKNNLQMISSLLQLQSRYMTEPGAVEALAEGESRVKSMAIIHHHLYSRDDVSSVDVQGYVESLCEQVLSSFSAPGAEVEVELRREVAPLRLDVSVMVPLGLILNELVTNAFKYAFVGRDRGTITIRLTTRGEGLELLVQDDGVGMDPGMARSGFGTRMIGAFLKKLGAEMDTQVLDGTRVTIHVPQVRRETLVQRSA